MSDVVVAAPTAPARVSGGMWRALLKSPSGVVGGLLLLVLVVLAVLAAAHLLPYDPAVQDVTARLQPPSGAHWFGTDQFGRDIFARVSSGIANSALVSLVAVAFATLVGTTAGTVSGYLRGATDTTVGGVANVIFAFPPLLLALTLVSVFARNWFTVAVAIAIVYTPIFFRVTRGPVLTLREVEYVAAAKTTGMGTPGILLRHILPNITGILIVQVTLSLSWAVLTEASLSFLGLGTPPPAASLGGMIYEARTLVTIAPWTLLIPGAVLIVFVIALNLLGDGLRDALDPNRKG